MRIFYFHFIFLAICNLTFAQTADKNDPLLEKANDLAHRFIIVDGHVDLPYRLQVKNFRLSKEFVGIPVESKEGDFDYVRAKKGGLSAPFMSIYIPSEYQQEGDPKAVADSLIDLVKGIIDLHPDKFAPGDSPRQIEQNFREGKISLPMGMENGAPIRTLADVAYYHARGIRYITLTHGKDNQICDSSYDDAGTWNGLSPYGRQVIDEMNRQGIMIDISHVSDAAFYQTIGLTRAPLIASHSSCRKFTPGFQRNMDDYMIKALGRNGGVIMINFGSDFLDSSISKNRDEMREKMRNMLNELGMEESDEHAQSAVENFRNTYEKPLFADVKLVADHIDHVVSLAGIDHVGFGSDFDGVGDTLPVGLKDVSAYPNLIRELLSRGYNDEDIEKICYGNLFRVWNEVEKVASSMNGNK